MAELTLKILDKNGSILCESSGENLVNLVYDKAYCEGDCIVLETSEKNIHIRLQLDDAMGAALCYITGNVSYTVPFGEKKISYSPKAFSGNKHYLYARVVEEKEAGIYRNLALNVYDQHGDTNCYPHAFANVETRGESVFAARNAIDGVCENRSHGEWPYESWGINMQDDAQMSIDFGQEAEIDKIVLFTRADFPHDNWWTQITLTFSDGTEMKWELEKSIKPHVLELEPKKISWIRISNLIKADDPSPFPALTQMEVYGRTLSI